MHAYLFYGLVGLAAFAAYKVLVTVFTRIQNASKARQLGCQDAPEYPDMGFIGIKYLRQMQAADNQQLFPDFLVKRHKVISEHIGRAVSTFKVQVLGQPIFVTNDPENIKALLATQFNDFDLGSARKSIMSPTLGHGIFTQDGEEWSRSRSMLRPNFVREQVSDLDMEERHVQALFSVMPVQQDGWTDFLDIQTRFFRLTIDAATEFLFGESVGSQIAEAEIDKMDKVKAQEYAARSFSYNFDRAQYHMARKFRYDDMHWLYSPAEYKVNGRFVNDFIARYVDLALSKGTAGQEKKENDNDHYVFLEALATQTQDPVELRAQLLNILLAGRDTTASLLSWFFHQMLRNQDVFNKLRTTVVETFGTLDNPQEITFETLKGCQYLQHCLNETNRLWPVVAGNARRSLLTKDTTLPRGGGPDGLARVFIPRNTPVEYSIHAMHRRKDLWGEDAEEFRPERFANRRPGWEFLPFNGGPRICIGQQFALTEAAYVIVRLLQKFDKIEAAPGELEGVTTSNMSLTNCPARLVTLRLHEAAA